MTTKPKAKKFRIRRSATQGGGADPVVAKEPAREAQAQSPAQAPAQAQAAGGQTRVVRPNPPARPEGMPERSVQPAQPAAQAPRPSQSQGAQTARPQNPADNPMQAMARQPMEDGFGSKPFPGAAAAEATGSAPEAEIAKIKQEGLTGRQLRMARRVAQKHGLAATSDYDAVRLLREAGVDPFQSANMLQLVAAEGASAGGNGAGGGDNVQLPQTVSPQPQNLPSTNVMDAADRARSIQDMQRDIAKRRRQRLVMLFMRLAAFVLLPTLVAGWYFFVVATPMYGTKSEFVIQKADAGGTSGLSGLFAGSGLATSQDSITVQSYLTSRDAMLRLDSELGFKAHFSSDEIDPIQRLEADATNEETYKVYKRNVKIGFDPTEGIMKMEVIAATPEFSAAVSEALIRYAEERVDTLTTRLRADQMKGAIESYEDAETQMLAAQNEVLRLQEGMGVFDATSDAAAVMGRINTFQTELDVKQLQLQQLLDNPRPNQARVDGVRGDIDRLETLIAQLRAQLTEGQGGDQSIANVSGQLQIAQTNLTTRTALMQQALQQLETARIEANKQTRYLSMGVHPVAPDTPTYPRSFENTILAFLIFAGIYLMVSITAAILREQVSG